MIAIFTIVRSFIIFAVYRLSAKIIISTKKTKLLLNISPEIKEETIATVEVLETFKISKVGTIAGCIVREGKITRTAKIRIIREGIVIYTGALGSLKRFKDDVKEVAKGFECGLNIENYNDIRVGDMIEGFQEVEVKKTL